MRLRSIIAIDALGSGLDGALATRADALLFTLADSRQPSGELRRRAAEGAARTRDAGKQVLVTVNHPRTQLLRDDVEALPLAAIAGVLLPHATGPQDVRDLAVVLREFELQQGIEPGVVAVFPVIDSARALLRAAETAAAAPRVAGLVLDMAAYAADVNARDEARGERLAYARGAAVAAARAHEGRPLVRGGDLELTSLSHYGFAGAILATPAHAETANTAFAPTPAAIERARAQASAYDAARSGEQWVARLGDGVVDAHTARSARRLIDNV